MTTYKKTVTTETLLTDWIRVEWQDCATDWGVNCPDCNEKIQPGDIILIVPAYEGYDFVHESHYE